MQSNYHDLYSTKIVDPVLKIILGIIDIVDILLYYYYKKLRAINFFIFTGNKC